MIGKENVLYFPETHLEPFIKLRKLPNANIVLRTEVQCLNFDKENYRYHLAFRFRKKC